VTFGKKTLRALREIGGSGSVFFTKAVNPDPDPERPTKIVP